jgi:acetyl-CoA/propionyl-CoA carboxylase biotin carboxyl carrier protein
MKMEYAVRAPVAGTVIEVRVRVGQQVAMDEPLAEVTASDTTQGAAT